MGGHITAALFLQEFLRKPTMIKNEKKLISEIINDEENDDENEVISDENEEENEEGEEEDAENAENSENVPSSSIKDDIIDVEERNAATSSEKASVMKEVAAQEVTQEIVDSLIPEFVRRPSTPWIHVDMAAYNMTDRPGRPKGGEAQGMRALYELIATKYGDSP